MSFFCAGSSNEIKKRMKAGSKPLSSSRSNTIVSSNGRVVNPFQDPKQKQQQQQQQQSQQQQQQSQQQQQQSQQQQQQQPQQQQQQLQQQQPQQQSLGPVSVPHSNSDLNSRKMIVLHEYRPTDNRGLAVRRGESLQIINQDQNWCYVRNERNKEGYVPSAHLGAPYTMMRSRRGFGNGIRPVASGSSIDIKDHAHSSVSLYPSTSAGRPRKYSMGDENRIESHGRGYSSPQDLSNNNNNSLSQGQTSTMNTTTTQSSSYDQKYSPSTSSGVASFTGTGSPVGHSDGSNHSSFCSIEEERERGGSGCSGGEGGGTVPMCNGHGTAEDVVRARDTSEGADRPRPHSHGDNPTRSQEKNVYVPDEAPPPLPPRTLYKSHSPPPAHSASQGDTHPEDFPHDESDPYASPADALQRQQGSAHIGQPRVRSVIDSLHRDVVVVQENGVYSEVFQGNQRPRRQNGYRLADEESNHSSEGGSNRSRTSWRSGSRVSSLRAQTNEPVSNSREYLPCESDTTLSVGVGGGWVEHALPPASANPYVTQSGSAKIKRFRKNLWGVYLVICDFDSYDENEVSVCKGDHVSVWNQDDPEWFWIVKHDTSEEGFVPSTYLQEILNDSQPIQSSEPRVNHQDQSGASSRPPPLPPKTKCIPPMQPLNRNHTRGYDNHTHFRQRAVSHDTRPTPLTSRNHQPGGSSGGGGGGGVPFRGRLRSDGQIQSPRGHPPTTPNNVQRSERSVSPPNEPPPPYTEVDSRYLSPTQPSRHFSLSQQTETPPPSQYNSTQLQRTRSHGQVPYRGVNVPRPPSGGDEGGQRGGEGERVVSPPDVFSPSDPSGGTLV